MYFVYLCVYLRGKQAELPSNCLQPLKSKLGDSIQVSPKYQSQQHGFLRVCTSRRGESRAGAQNWTEVLQCTRQVSLLSCCCYCVLVIRKVEHKWGRGVEGNGRREREKKGRDRRKGEAPAGSLLKLPQSQDPQTPTNTHKARTKSGAPNSPGLREVGRDLTAQTITRCCPATSRGIHISLLLTPCVPSSSLSLIFLSQATLSFASQNPRSKSGRIPKTIQVANWKRITMQPT